MFPEFSSSNYSDYNSFNFENDIDPATNFYNNYIWIQYKNYIWNLISSLYLKHGLNWMSLMILI